MPYEITDEFLWTRVKPDGIIPGDYVRNVDSGEIGWVFNQWHADRYHKIIIDEGRKGVLMKHWDFDEVELVGCRWPNRATKYCSIVRDLKEVS